MASDLEGLRQAEEEAFTALFMAAQERQPIIALLYAYRDAVEARVRAEVEVEHDEAVRAAQRRFSQMAMDSVRRIARESGEVGRGD